MIDKRLFLVFLMLLACDETKGSGSPDGRGVDSSQDAGANSGDGAEGGADGSSGGADGSGGGADVSGGGADVSSGGADVSGGGADVSGDSADASGADTGGATDGGDGSDTLGGDDVSGTDVGPSGNIDTIIAPIDEVMIVDSCDIERDLDGTKHLTESDILWATLGGEPLLMNLARPTQPGPHPLVVFVHGGGWSTGDRTHYDATIATVASNGYVAASVDYRLAGAAGNRFPTAVQDIRCAIRWLRANASKYDIDPQRVAIVGGSAGGHLAALVGLSSGDAAFDGECPVSGSADVSAIATFYGPSDLRASAYGGHEVGQWNVDILLGGMAADLPDAAAQASPVLYVDHSDPPVYLSHGDADAEVPLSESHALLAALQTEGVPSALVTVPDGEHGHEPDSAEPHHQHSTCTFFQFLHDTL